MPLFFGWSLIFLALFGIVKTEVNGCMVLSNCTIASYVVFIVCIYMSATFQHFTAGCIFLIALLLGRQSAKGPRPGGPSELQKQGPRLQIACAGYTEKARSCKAAVIHTLTASLRSCGHILFAQQAYYMLWTGSMNGQHIMHGDPRLLRALGVLRSALIIIIIVLLVPAKNLGTF